MDRNTPTKNPMISVNEVALRKESVDRNIRLVVSYNIKETVALRKESVDRNCVLPSSAGEFLMSLSARRAWIEMRE